MSKPRVLSTPKHRTFRLSKKKLKQAKKLVSSRRLFSDTIKLFSKNKKLFFGLAFIHFILTFIFVQGLSSSLDIVGIKKEIGDVIGDEKGGISTAFALYGFLIGSAGTTAGEAGSAYQLFIMLITSLAVIWTVRQLLVGELPRIKDGFYKGVYPLVPFILVLVVVSLQLIPLLAGNFVYNTVIQNGLAVTPIEQVIWLLMFIALALLSAYMLTSSLFALFIVTLPDMTPIKALRSARELVLHRRLAVWIRIIFMPVVLLLASAVTLMPLLLLIPAVSEIIFLLLLSFGLVTLQIYMYMLYRALI